MEETAGSSVWATLITAREKTLARDRSGVVGDQGPLVTGGLTGLLGTGEEGRAGGRAGGTGGAPGVLGGGVWGKSGAAVGQEGAVERRGQVCTEPAGGRETEKGASAAGMDGRMDGRTDGQM